MIRGTLDRLHLGDLMQWLQMGALSGRLTLTENRFARRLDLIDGQVVFVSSTVPKERLATWLASREVLSSAELRRLLGRSLLGRTMFTSLLTESGVGDDELKNAITRLGEVIISRLLLSRSVEFVFDPGYPVQDLLNLSLDVDPHSLLMEAARRSDELAVDVASESEDPLPHSGEAFERFFWALIRAGIGGDELIDGEQVIELHQLVRDIMRTLAQWLSSSPGLVPLPAGQVEHISGALESGTAVTLAGMPHAAWNQMVLHYALRSRDETTVTSLAVLEDEAAELDLWSVMVDGEWWRRPDAGRLDGLTRDAVTLWSKASAAAAEVLGVDPELAVLACHLLAVPCDLVLWVLATLPVPHHKLRLTLLNELPRRLGSELATVADLPEELQGLFSARDPRPLHAALSLGRRVLPSAALWLDPLGGDEALLGEIAGAELIAHAREAAETAAHTVDG